MIKLKVRSHGVETAAREYATMNDAVAAIETASVDRLDAIRVAHGEVFAYVGMHPSTGQRFAVWRPAKRQEP